MCVPNWFYPLHSKPLHSTPSQARPLNDATLTLKYIWAQASLAGVQLPPDLLHSYKKKHLTCFVFIFIYFFFITKVVTQRVGVAELSWYHHPAGRPAHSCLWQPHCSSVTPAPLSPSSGPRCHSRAACPCEGSESVGDQRPLDTDFPHSANIGLECWEGKSFRFHFEIKESLGFELAHKEN